MKKREEGDAVQAGRTDAGPAAADGPAPHSTPDAVSAAAQQADGEAAIWSRLRRHTPARIGLGRSGASAPTGALLRFGLAHAQARDAVHLGADTEAAAAAVRSLGWTPVPVTSRAASRDVYLRRPDLGRRLSEESRAAFAPHAGTVPDLAVIVADGLSATAIDANIAGFLAAFHARLAPTGLRVGPVAIATNARVALADELGEILGARASVILIGERPGLSSPDSLGAYLTFAPRIGRSDAERNCISNIRAGGLGHDHAAFKLAWLLGEALARGLSGVALKDASDPAWIAAEGRARAIDAAPGEEGRRG